MPPDQIIPWKVSVGHHSEDLVPDFVPQLHGGKGQLQLLYHSSQGCLPQGLSDSKEAVVRALLAVAYPIGHEAYLGPLLVRVHLVLAHLPLQDMPLFFSHLRYRPLELLGHIHSYRELDDTKGLFPIILGAVLSPNPPKEGVGSVS